MYLHLGKDVVVTEADIIGIFDLDNTTNSHISRKFLSTSEKSGCIVNVSEELPKSFILSDGEDGRTVFLSQLSSQTLQKRASLANFSC